MQSSLPTLVCHTGIIHLWLAEEDVKQCIGLLVQSGCRDIVAAAVTEIHQENFPLKVLLSAAVSQLKVVYFCICSMSFDSVKADHFSLSLGLVRISVAVSVPFLSSINLETEALSLQKRTSCFGVSYLSRVVTSNTCSCSER